MAFLQELIASLRRFRHDHEIPHSAKPSATAVVPDPTRRALLASELERVQRLGNWGDIAIEPAGTEAAGEARLVLSGATVRVPLAGLLDVEAERARLQRQREHHEDEAARIETKLADRNFTERAPEEIVGTQRERLEHEREAIAHLEQALRDLG
jgi:valyl-tRNA synthetase